MQVPVSIRDHLNRLISPLSATMARAVTPLRAHVDSVVSNSGVSNSALDRSRLSDAIEAKADDMISQKVLLNYLFNARHAGSEIGAADTWADPFVGTDGIDDGLSVNHTHDPARDAINNGSTDLNLVTISRSAVGIPDVGSALILVNNTASIIYNTDLTLKMSRDDGTVWDQAPLTVLGQTVVTIDSTPTVVDIVYGRAPFTGAAENNVRVGMESFNGKYLELVGLVMVAR